MRASETHANLTLRLAADSDRESVRALCERLDPRDYLPDAWDKWISIAGNQMLLAHCGKSLVGCVYAAPVAPGQVFSQGLRVHPDYRRLGAGTLLMNEQGRLLKECNIGVARGVTGAGNRRARGFFARVGWKEIATVRRRRLPSWKPSRRKTTSSPSLPKQLLVSHEGLAYFRRIYFSADNRWLAEAARQGRWHARDGAYVLLDPPSAEFGTWVIAAGGPPPALEGLLRELPSPSTASGLTVEAPDDPEIQSLLDRLGFAAAEPDGSYVVVECRLD